jgi:hypothetical protein
MSIVTLNNRGVRSVTTFGSVNTGSMVLIKKLTASSDDTLDFVDGTSNVVLDSTYKEYLFTFKNIHPGTNAQEFLFQGNAAGGSGFDETMTTTVFNANHNEADSDTGFGYVGGSDQAQGTSFQKLTRSVGADADQSCCGTLHLFNPSSTTFVTHYVSKFQEANEGDYSMNVFTAGYFNTTSAIDEIQFKFASGNIEAGDICLYGIL